jgi:hypothetical protein
MGSRRFAGVVAVAVTLVLPPTAAAASAHVNVVTLPSSGSGAVAYKTWSAYVSGAYMKRITWNVPTAYFEPAALSQLPPGSRVGEAGLQSSAGDSGAVTGGLPVHAGECPPATRGCVALAIRRSGSDRVLLTVQVGESARRGGGVVWFTLRLENFETSAGRLFRDNPRSPRRLDTSLVVVPCATYDEFRRCGADGRLLRDRVREVAGGQTSITLSTSRTRAGLWQYVVFSGRVLRGGRPSAGERVFLSPHYRLEGVRGEPEPGHRTRVVTGADGTFRIRRRMTESARWAAAAVKPAAGTRPRLNTVEIVTSDPLWVHAPRPEIEIVSRTALPDGRIRAEVVVRKPRALRGYGLTATVVAGDQVQTKPFPWSTQTLSFTVEGAPGTTLRASVFQEHPNPGDGWIPLMLAHGWSAPLSL